MSINKKLKFPIAILLCLILVTTVYSATSLIQVAIQSACPSVWIDVKCDYGAKGDGVTDDTIPIRNALNAQGPKAVCFPAGSYKVSALSITTNNTTLLGFNQATISQTVAGAANSVLTIAADNVVADGLSIEGQIQSGHEADEGKACILISYLGAPVTRRNVTIRNCTLTSKQAGIFTYNSTEAFAISNLTVQNNKIDTTHWGIYIGPWGRHTVVNDGIYILDNKITVTAGSYMSFEYARPLQVINTNNLIIRGNKSTGGFSGIETYCSDTGIPRKYQSNVQVVNNTTDGHIGFTQIRNGECSHNVVDIALRDASWPAYDNATVVAAWGYLGGIEAGDLENCDVSGNIIRNQVGAGIHEGGGTNVRVNIINNSIYNSCSTASPPDYAHGIYLDGKNEEVNVDGNVISTSAKSGIAQPYTVSSGNIVPGVSYHYLYRTSVSRNIIRASQHCGIQIQKGDTVSIIGNQISTPNLASGNYDGINFSGNTNIITNAIISDNLITGGRYGIYQPYKDSSVTRTLSFTNNVSGNATTDAFLIYGKSKNNRTTGNILSIIDNPLGHIPSTHGLDFFILTISEARNITRIDGGTVGNLITIQFNQANTTMKNDATYLRLADHADVTPTLNSTMTFVCILDTDTANNIWAEVSRSIY